MNNATVGAAPWYKSPVYISLGVSLIMALSMLFPKIAVQLGLDSPEVVRKTVELVMGWVGTGISGITAAASLYGMIKRAKSTVQPLTTTQAKADAHPATVVAAANVPAATAPISQTTEAI